MGLLATFVLAETDGLTPGPNRIISPITGVVTSIFQKFASIDPPPGGTLKRLRIDHQTMTPAWTIRIRSTHKWKTLPLCRSINLPLSFGTFSTLTGMEIAPSWNDWKLLMKILHGILFRFLDLEIWPTLPVIWRKLPIRWPIRPMKWQPCRT